MDCFLEHGLLARVKNGDEQGTHDRDADPQENEHTEKSAEQVLEARNRFSQNRVNRAIFDVLRNQTRSRDDREQRTEDRHRPKRDIFQDLKFLLKRKSRHEDRTPDEEKLEYQRNVKHFLPG